MQLGTFTRQRVRIERRFPAGAKREQAMRHLVRDAGAALAVVQRRAVGWRLPDGAMVCMKRRYSNEGAAASDIERIQATAPGRHVPIRAYQCEQCGGWHATSQVRNSEKKHRVFHD